MYAVTIMGFAIAMMGIFTFVGTTTYYSTNANSANNQNLGYLTNGIAMVNQDVTINQLRNGSLSNNNNMVIQGGG